MTAIWTILTSMAAMRRAGGARGATRPQLSVRLRKQNASGPEGSVRSTVNARREIHGRVHSLAIVCVMKGFTRTLRSRMPCLKNSSRTNLRRAFVWPWRTRVQVGSTYRIVCLGVSLKRVDERETQSLGN